MAIITHAVRITCVYEERAQGLLCSVHQARRAHVSASTTPNGSPNATPRWPTTIPRSTPPICLPATSNRSCATVSGQRRRACPLDRRPRTPSRCWLRRPADAARAAVERVCRGFAEAGTRQSAYETLRRDRHARALLDLPRRSWAALLKALLGKSHPAYVATSSGRGILLRLLLGETLDLLLRDDDLILALALAAPSGGGGEAS